MTETKNPLFDNERELLERQKEEYKNALMGDVDQIKTQGQKISKKVAIAGGVLVAGLLLKSMLSGGKKKIKKLANKKAAKKRNSHGKEPDALGFNTYAYEHDDYASSSERTPHMPSHSQPQEGVSKSFRNSELMQVVSQQVMALLLVYLTKKVEEYLSSVSKNNDIATAPIEVTEVETIAYTIPEEDAIQKSS